MPRKIKKETKPMFRSKVKREPSEEKCVFRVKADCAVEVKENAYNRNNN